jgi:hypothetical protein
MSLIAVALGALTPNFHATDLRRSVGPLAAYGTMFGSAAIWAVTVATVAVIALRLPANQGLVLNLVRGLDSPALADLFLVSPWPLLAIALVDVLAGAGLALLSMLATRRIAAWQPVE